MLILRSKMLSEALETTNGCTSALSFHADHNTRGRRGLRSFHGQARRGAAQTSHLTGHTVSAKPDWLEGRASFSPFPGPVSGSRNTLPRFKALTGQQYVSRLVLPITVPSKNLDPERTADGLASWSTSGSKFLTKSGPPRRDPSLPTVHLRSGRFTRMAQSWIPHVSPPGPDSKVRGHPLPAAPSRAGGTCGSGQASLAYAHLRDKTTGPLHRTQSRPEAGLDPGWGWPSSTRGPTEASTLCVGLGGVVSGYYA